ncbi:hypothetical protein [Verrucomicrobium spinosum]|uniref:hypothetical protein n=1 Tax=Verrucomicrobium spinosum TaxID=2736 RepID=UPI0004928A46|nr:hypothetical protein [Verrucomicrobium spinosum]
MMKWGIGALVLGALTGYQTYRAPVSHAPGVLAGNAPEQVTLAKEALPIQNQGWTLKPLAWFNLQARVLSKEHYAGDFPSPLAPYDLALGWGPMSDTAVLEKLDVSQSNRCYHWRYWGTSPIPEAELIRHSANMHLIPATPAVAGVIASFRTGSVVKLTGYLVEATHPQASHPWRSSLTREDTGQGSCEIVYVQFAREIEGK